MELELYSVIGKEGYAITPPRRKSSDEVQVEMANPGIASMYPPKCDTALMLDRTVNRFNAHRDRLSISINASSTERHETTTVRRRAQRVRGWTKTVLLNKAKYMFSSIKLSQGKLIPSSDCKS